LPALAVLTIKRRGLGYRAPIGEEMTQDNYEGTNPCHEAELAWRHEKVRYLMQLFKNLNSTEQDKFLQEAAAQYLLDRD